MKNPPTPEQINKLKADSGDAILLFHNDGFYEAFDADAERLVGLLELKYFNIRQPARTTTHFHGSDLERYLANLIASGCRVALVGRVQGEEIVHHVQVTDDDGKPN